MIDLLESSKEILLNAGYKVRKFEVDSLNFLGFEDSTVLGFCSVFDTPEALISDWLKREDAIVKNFEVQFQGGGEKLWNAYDVFLCQESGDLVQMRKIESIEEDVYRTRKIAGCGIRNEYELKNVLLPLLTFQKSAVLTTDDVYDRIFTRFSHVSPKTAKILMDPASTPDHIIQSLRA